MSETLMARPKGSPYPFQQAIRQDDGRYGIKYRMGGAIYGQMWDKVIFYNTDELEVESN